MPHDVLILTAKILSALLNSLLADSFFLIETNLLIGNKGFPLFLPQIVQGPTPSMESCLDLITVNRLNKSTNITLAGPLG